MQGSIDWQVRTVFETVNDIGSSKHLAKEEARDAGAKTFADLGQALGCHSYSTLDDYRAIAKDCASYIRSEYGQKDITRIESYQVEAFLKDKIENGGRSGDGVARQTLNKYGAALEKFEQSLNRFSEVKGLGYEYNFQLKEVRAYGAEKLGPKSDLSRAYANPQALIGALHGENAHLGKLILETGCRIDEISYMKPGQLLGEQINPLTGEKSGVMHVYGKGGAERNVYCSLATYKDQAARVEAQSRLNLSEKGSTAKLVRSIQGSFRSSLSRAAATTGQKYESAHGLRWNWAQKTHGDLQSRGISYSASLSMVSQAMGHQRSDITTHYLH